MSLQAAEEIDRNWPMDKALLHRLGVRACSLGTVRRAVPGLV